MTTGRFPADEEYEKNESVRTLVNAIAMLRASAPSDYEFWSAFYKFALMNEHRVFTYHRANSVLAAEKKLRELELAGAADTFRQKIDKAAQSLDKNHGSNKYQQIMQDYLRSKANLKK
jgi:gamma-glutamylcysteine synthetase